MKTNSKNKINLIEKILFKNSEIYDEVIELLDNCVGCVVITKHENNNTKVSFYGLEDEKIIYNIELLKRMVLNEEHWDD